MAEQDRKPRVIIENNTTAIELRCEDISVEVPVEVPAMKTTHHNHQALTEISSGSSSTSDKQLRKEQVTGIRDMLRPLRGGATSLLFRLAVNDIDELLKGVIYCLEKLGHFSENTIYEGSNCF